LRRLILRIILKKYDTKNIKCIKTLIDEFFIFPSFRGEENFELVIGLALTGSGDVGAVALRIGEWLTASFCFSFSTTLSVGNIGDSGTLRSSSSRECSNYELTKLSIIPFVIDPKFHLNTLRFPTFSTSSSNCS